MKFAKGIGDAGLCRTIEGWESVCLEDAFFLLTGMSDNGLTGVGVKSQSSPSLRLILTRNAPTVPLSHEFFKMQNCAMVFHSYGNDRALLVWRVRGLLAGRSLVLMQALKGHILDLSGLHPRISRRATFGIALWPDIPNPVIFK